MATPHRPWPPGRSGLSQQVFALILRVPQAQGLPAGPIGLVRGAGIDVGVNLIRHPLIAAGAFTGSTRDGAALQAQANARARPIPFNLLILKQRWSVSVVTCPLPWFFGQ